MDRRRAGPLVDRQELLQHIQDSQLGGVSSSTHCPGMAIGELLRVTRERHGLTQARLARRTGSDRAYVSRVERGKASPTIDWVQRALAAMGEELVLEVRRGPFDDHDPQAHRLVGSWDGDRRLDDVVASAAAMDSLVRCRP
jgi:DNA-binding XRE family transcriptional regulator